MDAEYLRSLFSYDEQTGILRWKVSGGNVKVGDEAGGPSLKGKRIYRIVGIKGRTIAAHRIIGFMFLGLKPDQRMDHINGDGLDNRFVNLRVVTDQENNRNLRLQDRNKTGVTGVSVVRNGSFGAFVIVSKVRIWLGTFADFFEAVAARKSAELRYGFHPNHGNPKNLEAPKDRP